MVWDRERHEWKAEQPTAEAMQEAVVQAAHAVVAFHTIVANAGLDDRLTATLVTMLMRSLVDQDQDEDWL